MMANNQNIIERLNQSRDRITKSAQKAQGVDDNTSGHQTDKDLDEEENKNHPSGDVSEEVKDIGGAGIDGSGHDLSEPDKGEGAVSDSSSLSNKSPDGVPDPSNKHETDEDLKEAATKNAQAMQSLRESKKQINQSTQSLQNSLGELVKACQSNGDGDEDKEKGDDESSSDDSKPKTPLEKMVDEEKKEEGAKDEDDEDGNGNGDESGSDSDSDSDGDYSEEEVKAAEVAGELASESADETISAVMDIQKQAAFEQQMAQYYQHGHEQGLKLAQTLDAQAQAALGEGGMPAPPEGGIPGGGLPGGGIPEEGPLAEESLSEEEILAIAQTLLDGKEPESPAEKEVAKMLEDLKPLIQGEGGGGEPSSDDESSSAPGESSDSKDDDDTSGSSIKEDIPAGGMAAMASMDPEQAMEFYKAAKPEAQADFLRSINQGD